MLVVSAAHVSSFRDFLAFIFFKILEPGCLKITRVQHILCSALSLSHHRTVLSVHRHLLCHLSEQAGFCSQLSFSCLLQQSLALSRGQDLIYIALLIEISMQRFLTLYL